MDNAQAEYSLYKKLCRGEPIKEHKSVLKCRYFHGHNDYLKIGPFKEEEVNLSPRIVIYYEVLSESETNTVKSLATPR